MDCNDTIIRTAATTQRPWQQQLQQMFQTRFESLPKQPQVRQKPSKPLKKQARALLKNLEELYEEEPPKLSLKDQLERLRIIKKL